MKEIKVSLDEVIRHFFRTQSNKPELKDIAIENLTFTQALDKLRTIPDYSYIGKRIEDKNNWTLSFIDEELFKQFKAIESYTWLDLSNGSLKIFDIAKKIMKEKDTILKIYPDTVDKISDLKKKINVESIDFRLIVNYNDNHYEILDGNCRATAMAIYFMENKFDSFFAYIGY